LPERVPVGVPEKLEKEFKDAKFALATEKVHVTG
jgi:hypothetical protein